VDEVPHLVESEDWALDAEYAINGMRIPRLYQYDYRKVICFYYGRPKSVATSGCGATSMSMVIAYLTGNTRQSPYTLFRWAINNQLYEGSGLTHEALLSIGENYGVGGEWIRKDKDQVIAALQAGKPVIAHMGYGQFTRRGHYIVLRGLTGDGRVLVNDPNSFFNSVVPFKIEDILRQTKTSTPFLICDLLEDNDEPTIE
ncbi:C39 family peptidase, partial [Eubacteriales bacterium OttesenSCG-928-N13]|nr:C39 family peptidase [Eubacteriales bacterium OttesenSCG-928-N13]